MPVELRDIAAGPRLLHHRTWWLAEGEATPVRLEAEGVRPMSVPAEVAVAAPIRAEVAVALIADS